MTAQGHGLDVRTRKLSPVFVPGGPRMRFVRALDARAPRSFGPIFACFPRRFVRFANAFAVLASCK